MRCSVLVALAVAAAVVITASPAGASNGLMYVSSDTTLGEDHYGSIVVMADNVTLDCAGHSVVAPASGADYGITIVGRSGVTVKNCTVTGFRRDGVFLSGASDNLLTGNSANGNGTNGDFEASGFLVDSTSGSDANGNVFRGNVADGNQGGGFLLHGHGSLVTNTVLDHNLANDNLWFGFGAWRASGNSWTGNTANGSAHWGFALFEQSTANILSANIALGNTADGFLLQGASANLLTANTANANGTDGNTEASGFLIDSNEISNADGNILRGNVANSNNGGGFLVHGHGNPVTGTIFDRNIANKNLWFGFGAWHANANSWTNNIANSSGHWGFAFFEECSGNHINANTARSSGQFDAYDLTTLNIWTHNNFGTTHPTGLD